MAVSMSKCDKVINQIQTIDKDTEFTIDDVVKMTGYDNQTVRYALNLAEYSHKVFRVGGRPLKYSVLRGREQRKHYVRKAYDAIESSLNDSDIKLGKKYDPLMREIRRLVNADPELVKFLTNLTYVLEDAASTQLTIEDI